MACGIQSVNVQDSKAVYEELFNGPTPFSTASLVPETFTYKISKVNRMEHWLFSLLYSLVTVL